VVAGLETLAGGISRKLNIGEKPPAKASTPARFFSVGVEALAGGIGRKLNIGEKPPAKASTPLTLTLTLNQ
jgi:GTP:adenosylcobinamide-phosphate guanylyltransferase